MESDQKLDPPLNLSGKRVFVAGHRGMLGSAIMRRLAREDCALISASREDVDLTRQPETEAWFERHRPEIVFVAAAKVGGILANSTYPAEFLYQNLAIGTNLIHAAYRSGVERLLYIGSTCIYPKLARQPTPESELLSGPLEPSNEWYALAKIAGIKLCQAYRKQYGADFISCMPTNLYGPNDNYDLESGHVLPALVRKIHEAAAAGAPSVTLWGTGTPLREFLHADDCADALVHLMRHYVGAEPVNVGSGREISIRDLALLIAGETGYSGGIVLDSSKPDGTPRKLSDTSRLRSLGWRPSITLEEGIRRALDEYEALAAGSGSDELDS